MTTQTDVEMKDSVLPPADKAGSELSLSEEIELAFGSLQKAANNFDNRYVFKVFRELRSLRSKIAQDVSALTSVISAYYPSDHPSRKTLLDKLPAGSGSAEAGRVGEVLPETNAYLHLLVQLYLLDTHDLDKLDEFNQQVITLLNSYNRRTLDFISAKMWFYISRSAELRNDLLSVRPALLAGLRSATLRHDDETTASIITLLLRNYLLTHDISQAANFCEKIDFPANAGNALTARYYYYLSRINAVQLDYSAAHECVVAAIRKAPQTKLARGFLQEATKLSIIIELLMGDIPELKVFKSSTGNLEPYFLVTRAVRLGDLKMFEEVLNKYEAVFVKDNNFTLVSKLRQNVIKTGIRMISLSYSRISLKEICIKLHLDSEEATEYIVSKAIRDGVIDASVNHKDGYMQSRELLDVYSTKAPQEEFNQRIRFCLSLYNDSVKAMRYPSSDSKPDVSSHSLEGLEDEMGLLQAIEDGDLDDFMD
ncbi:putative 26S proteasome regulatory subunit [Clavispora lusitaniae]|uniref:26S proteasome regulatory subunit n=2 Tax=Clavispora lusitaniae TaxID=36911 RepID=A0ACD0WCM9_CLALS|nr:26S proteasome non-ATPase regulatory subunit [Clavispora lusitaniae]OVF06544.1 putative proteasome regulatory particle lid subunit [Clavispora lusitaniae]QFZ25043.1 putative 26S proteasome regulatory subunit [Clavispora lusitaniae]QFZ31654.1 putative 26S proteasome regulatory subunit [Clavispora lusitaniae]QFZ37322.1 putative 26S proteasome regulatory subunit [Clavispora lusitaniae]